MYVHVYYTFVQAIKIYNLYSILENFPCVIFMVDGPCYKRLYRGKNEINKEMQYSVMCIWYMC